MKIWRAWCSDHRAIEDLDQSREEWAGSRSALYAAIREISRAVFEVEEDEPTPDMSALVWAVRCYECGPPTVGLLLAAFRQRGFARATLESYDVEVTRPNRIRELRGDGA